jgi:Tfp pilus assembly protein FimT
MAVAILGIITAIGLPSFNDFLVKTRVNNEISELNRLILTARSIAVNGGNNVIICPITTKCTTNWHNQISVFIDNNNDGDYDADDTIVKVKEPIQVNDKLQYGVKSLTYTPTGRLSGAVSATPFSYCPYGHSDRSRGIVVSMSGRSYVTSDTDNDDKDEDRNNNEISCT